MMYPLNPIKSKADGRAALVFSLIILIIMPLMNGCTKKEEAGRKVIHFVTWKPNQPEVWEEIYRLFEMEHPEIEVRREIGPHSSTAFHDMLTQKLKNKSRDVDLFLMDVIWPPEFAAAGWATPLDDYFPSTEQERFLEGTTLANTYNGRIYGVPLFINSGMLYYRKDLLEEYGFSPPATWDELVKQAGVIVSAEKKKGVELYGYSGQFKQYEGLVCDMMEFILSNNGGILNHETGECEIDGREAIDAVRFVRDRIIGGIAPAGVLTYQEPESLSLFLQGRAVFHRNWPYAWKESNNPEKSKVAGRVGITRLPHFEGGRSYATLGGWQVGVSSFSENKDAAWMFAEFLTSERIQKLIALSAGKAPTRKVLYDDPEVNVNPQFSYMFDVFLTAYPRPRTPLYPSISNILQRYFSKAISSPDSDIKREARAACDEIKKITALAR